MESIDLPKPTKKRLIQLLAILQKWPDKKITSVAISETSGWKSSLIRHDLWLLGFKKGVSNGYYIEELEQVIKSALNISFKKDTFMLSKKESNVAYTSDSSTAVVGSGSAEGIFKKVCIAGLGRLGASLLDQNLLLGEYYIFLFLYFYSVVVFVYVTTSYVITPGAVESSRETTA